MSFSYSLSAAQQRTLISTANLAVERFAMYISAKIGCPGFFRDEELQDIAGETLYNVCRSIASYDPQQSKMTTWVSRAAVNCVKDAIDYKMKRLAISEPLIFAEDEDGDDSYCLAEHCDKRIGFNPDMLRALTEYSPDKHLDQVQFEESVRRETRKLSDKNQHYLQMLEDGCTPKEMAKREGCTPNSAAKRVFDIRKALKETLAEVARDFDVICDKLVC